MKLFTLGSYDHDDETGLAKGDTIRVILSSSAYAGREGTVVRFSGGKRLFVYVRLEDDVVTRKFLKTSVKKVEAISVDGTNTTMSDCHARKITAEEWVADMSLPELSELLVLVSNELSRRCKSM